jgi:hypothetical protein
MTRTRMAVVVLWGYPTPVIAVHFSRKSETHLVSRFFHLSLSYVSPRLDLRVKVD